MSAIILTDGQINNPHGKTAHGLITGLSRYPIVGVVDAVHADHDAGVLSDGIFRNIPIFESIDKALSKLDVLPTHCIVGVATSGGYISPTLLADLQSAIKHKMIIVNGLHELVSEHKDLKPLIEQYSNEIIDLRRPKAFHDLHHWKGDITHIKTPRIAVLGMDCAIGKRTTTQLLYQACNKETIRTEMIYTGQTGWLQGFNYGFIFDSTLNDFVSGELEHAIVSCVKDTQPELLLIEGQSSLRNPSGPCGAEFICSGGAKGVILQYPAGQEFYSHGEEEHYRLPTVASEIELIKQYGAEVLAVTMNTGNLPKNAWSLEKERLHNQIKLPVICPREEGVSALIPIIKQFLVQQARGIK